MTDFSDEPIHPLVALGTAMSSIGGVASHYALMFAGLAVGWLGLYLDLRVRMWIRKRIEEEARKPKPDHPTNGKS